MIEKEYPFGFGFALMENPKAMERFQAMSEPQKRALGRRLRDLRTEQELRMLVAEMASPSFKI